MSEGAQVEPGGVLSVRRFLAVYPGYNVCVLLRNKHVMPIQVTSAEYTGLIWAVIIRLGCLRAK